MKLSGAAAARALAAPDPARAGLLLYGADAVRVSEARRRLLPALLGPAAEEEMRLARLPAADLRRDPAALQTAMTSAGFFPGPRAVLVEDAADGLAPILADALAAHRPGDAQIVATAGALPARSKLRRAFEDHPSAAALPFYDDPPGRAEVEAALLAAGAAADPGALAALEGIAREGGPAALRDCAEKLALYMHGRPEPAGPEDVAAVAPAPPEAELDAVLAAAAAGDAAALAPLLRRLPARAGAAVALVLGATRHFRTLHAAATAGAASIRPPLYGPRRALVERQARHWGAARLEEALAILIEADLALRAPGARAPAMPVAERALVRLAMLARR